MRQAIFPDCLTAFAYGLPEIEADLKRGNNLGCGIVDFSAPVSFVELPKLLATLPCVCKEPCYGGQVVTIEAKSQDVGLVVSGRPDVGEWLIL